MIRKTFLTISLLLILFISISAISANENADLLSNESSTQRDDFTIPAVQHEIDGAGEGDEISLDGTYQSNADILNVNKSVTLKGSDRTVFKGSENAIGQMNITANGSVIENIEFRNDFLIELHNSTTFINCKFIDNNFVQWSAINAELTDGNSLNIINCTFTNNQNEEKSGGAISVDSKNSKNTNVNIINSRFENNCALDGGAVYIHTTSDDVNYLNIINSTFKDNFIYDENGFYGPDISGTGVTVRGKTSIFDEKKGYIKKPSTKYTVNIVNSIFDDAAKIYYGEPFYTCVIANGENINIENSSFKSPIKSANNQINLNINNSKFYNANFELISENDPDEDIDDVDDEFNDFEPAFRHFKSNVRNCLINNATIFFLGDGNIENNLLIQSQLYGLEKKTIAFKNNTFMNNSILSVGCDSTVENCSFTDSFMDIYAPFTTTNVNINNCSFLSNEHDKGGAIRAERMVNYDLTLMNGTLNLNISNSIFKDNHAYYGGAISDSFTEGSLNIENSSFISNSAFCGGAVFSLIKDTTIKNCIFDNNFQETVNRFITNKQNPWEQKLYNAGIINLTDDKYSEKLTDETGKTYYSYFAKTIYGNFTANDNFWGYNLDNATELILRNEVTTAPATWINVNDEKEFVRNTGEKVSDMPKYEFKNTDGILTTPEGTVVNKNNANISATHEGKYYRDNTITVNLKDEKGNPIANKDILIKFSNKHTASAKTNNNGIAKVTVTVDVGTYSAVISSISNEFKYANTTLDNIKISKLAIVASTKKITTTFDSGKGLAIKVLNKNTKKAVSGITLNVKVFTGKKFKTYPVTSNSKGIATFKPASKVNAGSHKVEITSDKNCILTKVKTTMKINKAKTTIKAPKVTNKLKKSKYFKVTVKNKATKKVVKNLKIKVKVGKKTYTLKTNSKGVAQLNTKNLKAGTYAVKITSANSNYVISAKSTIVIKI